MRKQLLDISSYPSRHSLSGMICRLMNLMQDFEHNRYSKMTRDSVVSTVPRLWTESPRNRGLLPFMGKRLLNILSISVSSRGINTLKGTM